MFLALIMIRDSNDFIVNFELINVDYVSCFSGKKGGALASSVHSYMNHGDPAVQTLVCHLLSVVSRLAGSPWFI